VEHTKLRGCTSVVGMAVAIARLLVLHKALNICPINFLELGPERIRATVPPTEVGVGR